MNGPRYILEFEMVNSECIMWGDRREFPHTRVGLNELLTVIDENRHRTDYMSSRVISTRDGVIFFDSNIC